MVLILTTYRAVRAAALLAGLLLFGSLPAHGAISLQLASNFDATHTTAFPNGDKPQGGTCPPASYTGANLGDGGGTVCAASATELDFNVTGSGPSNQLDDIRIAYIDAGAGEVQVEGRVLDDYAGSTETFAGLLIGVRESALDSSWTLLCKSLQVSSTSAQCQYGTPGSMTTVNCAASGTDRPVSMSVTYYPTGTVAKGFTSIDGGSTWSECISASRNMSDVLAYTGGGSRSASTALTGTIDSYALLTEIDAYDETGGVGGGPTLSSAIEDQNGVQGAAFSLDYSGNFSGETPLTHPYTIGADGLPASTGLSLNGTTGVLSGTPNANDVGTWTADLCASNSGGTTCDNVAFSFTASTGNTFTIPTSTVGRVFDCSIPTGAPVAAATAWNSLTPADDVKPDAGDTIVFAGGTHSNNTGASITVQLLNCHGDESQDLFVRNDTADNEPVVIRRSRDVSGSFVFQIKNSTHVTVDGSNNLGNAYSGVTGQCGVHQTTGVEGRANCGFEVTRDADATRPSGYVHVTGTSEFITIRGMRSDGVDHADRATEGSGGNGFVVDDQSLTAADFDDGFRDNILFENNFAENTGARSGEGFYIGGNGDEGNAPLRNIEVRYNLVEDTARDSITVKSTYSGTNLTHHNHVYRSGQGLEDKQNEGFSFQNHGNAYVYSNYIEESGGPCINFVQLQAPSITRFVYVYNNICVRPGTSPTAVIEDGIRLNGTTMTYSPAQIFNNTLINVPDFGILCGSGVSAIARDNIIAEASEGGADVSNCTDTSNSKTTVVGQAFVDGDPGGDSVEDYHLTVASPACGASSNDADPLLDYDDEARPEGVTGSDDGADEAQACL